MDSCLEFSLSPVSADVFDIPLRRTDEDWECRPVYLSIFFFEVVGLSVLLSWLNLSFMVSFTNESINLGTNNGIMSRWCDVIMWWRVGDRVMTVPAFCSRWWIVVCWLGTNWCWCCEHKEQYHRFHQYSLAYWTYCRSLAGGQKRASIIHHPSSIIHHRKCFSAPFHPTPHHML